MFEGIKHEWHVFAKDEAGARFVRRYERKRLARPGLVGRIAWVGAGLVFLLLGLVMLFTPGPGLLAMGFGATCLAGESRPLARSCDSCEMRVRRWYARFRRRRG